MGDEKVKKFKQVCECKNCGNEAEMVITCTLESEDAKDVEKAKVSTKPPENGHVHTKGHGVCSHCGGEADIWLDV